MGFDPQQPRGIDDVENYVENSIVALASLDAFIAATVICLREDGTNTAGGLRRKLYQKSFNSQVANVYSQTIG